MMSPETDYFSTHLIATALNHSCTIESSGKKNVPGISLYVPALSMIRELTSLIEANRAKRKRRGIFA